MHQQTRRRVVLEGRVQGVGFRYCAMETANELGLRGTVRNRDDGTVEIQAEGTRTQWVAFLGRLREGPPVARVDGVRDCTPTPDPLPLRFEIIE